MKGRPMPSYTFNELVNKFIEDEKFNKLYDDWVKNNYNIYESPSLDRIDNNISYTFDNVQWMTWQENFNKGVIERSKIVIQMTIKGKFLKEWPSLTDAAKGVNVGKSAISQACSGTIKTVGGYKWGLKKINQVNF